jgi:AcrR family transcriptional regulator
MVRPRTIENRAEQIIAAADELFSRYGYERTSIDDIAKHLGIGKGSIYLEFKTKQDILIEILRRHAESILNLFEERLNNIKGSPLQALREALEEGALLVFDRVSSGFHTPEALLHTSLEMKKNHCKDFYIRKRELLVSFLKKAAAAGEINKSIANEETAAILRMGMANLYPPYLDSAELDVPMTREMLQEKARRLTTLLVNGLKNNKV